MEIHFQTTDNVIAVEKVAEQHIGTKYCIYLFIWGFYVAFNTVQVISRRVVGRAEETSTYSSLGFCTVNCRPTASNRTPDSEVGGKSVTTLPLWPPQNTVNAIVHQTQKILKSIKIH